MKCFLILIVGIFLSYGCSTTKAIENQPKAMKEVIEVDKMEDEENIQVVTTETPIKSEKKDIIEAIEVEEDLSFHQNLSKREGPLHFIFDELLQKHVTKNGSVDYNSFKESHSHLLGYISILTKMYTELDKVSREEKLAYWINTYNALTIDLILRNYPTKSIKDIKDPWEQRLWKFGDKWLNLNDIEHKILREMNEPRIHFAIVCASVSCPKLQNKAFTASNLEEQLTKATKEFLMDTSKNKLSKGDIKLSKIFKWFKKDFEQNGSLIDFLNTYADVTISDKAKKSFMDYNWGLNE